MLDNCIDIFKKSDMLSMVLDKYVPADGDYVVMEYQDDNFVEKIHIQVKQDKKTRRLNISETERREIAKLDYYSKLLEMNKPIDPKKMIHSNSYLSFWIKKENLQNKSLTVEIIEKYYSILLNPRMKYTQKNNLELYESVEEEIGPVNQHALEKVREWILENIFQLPFEVTGKDYLKIFFLLPDTDVVTEGKRYLIPNLYNKNDYNVKVNNVIYGVPNNNMQMNSKKPFLEYKHRRVQPPLLQTSEEVMNKKLFFDYLINCAANAEYNIYFMAEKDAIDQYEIRPLTNKEFPKVKEGYGFYLRVSKGKNEAEIIEMDRITHYRSRLKPALSIENYTAVNTEKMKIQPYTTYTTLEDLSKIVNSILFMGYLNNNYFTKEADITGLDGIIKQNLLLSRTAFFDWFYKGNMLMVKSIWDKLMNSLIRHSIECGTMGTANNQFNLKLALKKYFQGGKLDMADIMVQVRESIRTKINSKSYESIHTNEEYYYAVGQLVAFFISKNKSKKKPHSFFNGFLNTTKDSILKDRLKVLFKKYDYDIEFNSKRFNNLFSMIMSYQPEGKMEQDYMIAGYISNNLIYEKGEE